ncbi:MAG: class I SAM-dependent methyltransferase [Candidatus Acidiferrales bacterium]
MPISSVEQRTGQLYGGLWSQYDDDLFVKSLQLFKDRWLANGEAPDFFAGKRCLDVGCGGGRYSFAMALMGAQSVVGVDVSESGLADAAQRGERLAYSNVTFKQSSALELPFPDAEFDFVCCSGVLHHTRSVERGLREIHRVLKPAGSLYLLLYGAGGVFWPLNYLLRPFAALVGQHDLDEAVENAGYAANKRRSVLDDLFVPILETYSKERVEQLLSDAGFPQHRRWTAARLDHETDAHTMLAELETRVLMWEAGYRHSADPTNATIQMHCANLCRTVIAAIRDLIEQHKMGRLTPEQLQDTVVGHGHHRLVATRS